MGVEEVSKFYSLTIYPGDTDKSFVVELRNKNERSDFKAIAKIYNDQLSSIEFRGRAKSDEMDRAVKIIEKSVPEFTKAYYVLRKMNEYINQE
jgi:hypothetical protein